MANDRLQQQLQHALDQAVSSADELCSNMAYRSGKSIPPGMKTAASLLSLCRIPEACTLHQVYGY